MNLTAVLLTGLLAGGVTCAAVQGGLLTGLITRQRVATTGLHPADTRPAAPERGTPADSAPLVTTRRLTLADDLAPVGGFLAGKLISHTALGGLLGATAALQLLAGAIVLVFGLAQLGVPGLRRIVVEPPHTFGRLVLRSSRSQAAFAPGLLGLASVLIPCGWPSRSKPSP